jgi:fibronectin-binding autotransporter adhesin
VPEALILAGNMQNEFGCALYSSTTNVWMGSVTLVSNSVIKAYTSFGGGMLRVAGAISGPGRLIKVGVDPLELIGTNANTYSGGTFVHEGVLLLNKTNAAAVPGALTIGDGTNSAAADEVRLLAANQIADTSIVEVKRLGTLNLNSFAETVGSLEGAGTVSAGFGTLTAGGNNFTTTFSGLFNGVGFTSLIKQGTGTLLFTGTNGALGKTIVKGGKLFAHGVISAPVVVSNSATLGGNGSVGNVISTNGVVSPGAGAGRIETKGLVLDSSSSLRIELKGTNAGITYDQVNVAGVVALGNAALNATLEFGSVVSNKFIIINNDGADAVSGTFAGLPEGVTTLLGGATFRISYVGGDGNDVVLTQTTSLPQATMRGAVCLPNGQMQVNGEGVAGSTYHVFANANLNTIDWVFIGTALSAPNGQIQFTDTNAVSFPMRFYQFLLP